MAIFHVMKYDVKCGTCLHKFDCRETTLSNAANHFEIFLIEFEICLDKHLYFLYIRNTLFPTAVFVSMLWQLKVNMFLKKKKFSNCIKHKKVQQLLIGVLVPLTVCSIDKTNIFFYIIYEKCSFHS